MLTVEKIEGRTVRVESTGTTGELSYFEADISLFDGDVKEGDVIKEGINGGYITDFEETARRRKEVLDLQNSLWD